MALWPSVVIARLGLSHIWVITPIFVLVIFVALAFWLHRGRWWRAPVGGIGVALLYCSLAVVSIELLPVPLPAKTPYKAQTEQRATYLHSYADGYRTGLVGVFRSWCFMPDVETSGSYDGMMDGLVVWYRMLGQPMPDGLKRASRAWAGIDGVALPPKQ